jgi:hypothetical protein
MLPSVLTAAQARKSLVARRAELEQLLAEFTEIKKRSDAVPPHVSRGVLLWYDVTVAEIGWVREAIDDLKAGRFAAADREWGWQPPPEDPGWQMSADRERYRSMLGR